MNAAALRLHGRWPRWSGWALTGAVHMAMLLALASAFTPERARPAPVTISARLVSSAPPVVALATPIAAALPGSALQVPALPDIPPPVVQTTPTPPVAVTATPLRFDPPAASAADADIAGARPTAAAAMTAMTAVTTTSPAPPPALAESPAGLPPDHQRCSDRQTARHYPAMLRERGIQGLVRLRVKVDADGRAAEVVVSGGSGWRLLDEAARRVAESCPYVPARRGEQRLVSWVEYPVRFALQPSTLQ